MLALMIRSIIVAGIATIAALCFEFAARNRGVGTRFAWLSALAMSVVLPLVPRLFATSALPVSIPIITDIPTISIGELGNTNASSWIGMAGIMAIASALVGIIYLLGYLRLKIVRRSWKNSSVQQHDVLISQNYGPAVCGFHLPRIVVPSWVLNLQADEQAMIIAHENQHIRAHDQWLVLLSLLMTVAAPWNPFVWMQMRRLRFAIEADCDQRVLASMPDRGRYASLLLDVGRHHSGLIFTPALAEHRHGLEQRIRIIATSFVKHRGRALLATCAGALLAFAACEARLPNEPQPATERVIGPLQETHQPEAQRLMGLPLKERSDSALGGVTEDFVAAISGSIRTLMREKGIEGTAMMRMHVGDDGSIDEVRIDQGERHMDVTAQAREMVRGFRFKNTDQWLEFTMMSLTETRLPLKREGSFKVRSDVPSFTPYTVKPELQNREEVGRALVEAYPPLLRGAGIGGTSLVWLLVDETGAVQKSLIKTSSDRPELDDAAIKVAMKMKFSPARNREAAVPVWIVLPIVFKNQ